MTYAASSGRSGRVRSAWVSGAASYASAAPPSTVISGRVWAGSRGAVALSVIRAAGAASPSM